jgi:hypothetical protein
MADASTGTLSREIERAVREYLEQRHDEEDER